LKAPARSGFLFQPCVLDRIFFESEINHFVMAITAAETIVRHIARHQLA
jgi:hypothetical protein